MNESTPIHVIKLGGSLLTLSDLVARFEAFCAQYLTGDGLLVVGGGEPAETVRFFDRHVGFDETTGHWLAIRAMQFNAHLVAKALPDCTLIHTLEECHAVWTNEQLAIVDPLAWLIDEEHAGRGVPHRWQFTSDSIAAYAAKRLSASRLTLLKSTSARADCTLQYAAARQIVDAHLPKAAADVPNVELVNLRDDSMQGHDLIAR
jgi:aspartokinase-like uncharacterized kinase